MLQEMTNPFFWILFVGCLLLSLNASPNAHLSQRRKDFPTLFYPGSDRKFVTLAPNEVPVSSQGLGLDHMFRNHQKNNKKHEHLGLSGRTADKSVTPSELTPSEPAEDFFAKALPAEVVEGPADDIHGDTNFHNFNPEGRELPVQLSEQEEARLTKDAQHFPKLPVQVIYIRPGSEESPSLFDNNNNFDDFPIEPQGSQFPLASVPLTQSFGKFQSTDQNRQPEVFQTNFPDSLPKTPKALRPYPSQLSVQELVSPPPSSQLAEVQQFEHSTRSPQNIHPTQPSFHEDSQSPNHHPQNFEQDTFMPPLFQNRKPLPQNSVPPPPTTQKPPSFRPIPLQHQPLSHSDHLQNLHTDVRHSEPFIPNHPTSTPPSRFPSLSSNPPPPNFHQQDLGSLDSQSHFDKNLASSSGFIAPPDLEHEVFTHNFDSAPFAFGVTTPPSHAHISTTAPDFLPSDNFPHSNHYNHVHLHGSAAQTHHSVHLNHQQFQSFEEQNQNLELGEFKHNEAHRFRQFSAQKPSFQQIQQPNVQHHQHSNIQQHSNMPLVMQQQKAQQTFFKSRQPHLLNTFTSPNKGWTQGKVEVPHFQHEATGNLPFVNHMQKEQGALQDNRNNDIHNEATSTSITGNAGADFPNHSTIPATSFSCRAQQYPGYYADVDARCQVFHICYDNNQFSFLCPNGTLFDQRYMVCNWWYQVDCSKSGSFFHLNSMFSTQEQRF